MALHAIDGMSCYEATAEADRRGNIQKRAMFENNFGPDVDTHPLSGDYIYDNSSNTIVRYGVDSSTDATTWYVGCRWYVRVDEHSGSVDFMQAQNVHGTVICSLHLTNGGEIIARNGTATNLAYSTDARLRQKRWYFIEWRVTIHDSTGIMQVWVDGRQVINESALDTQGSTDGQVTLIGAGYDISPSQSGIADLYILDDGGSTFNSRLGDQHIEMVRPDGDGNRNNFTPLSGLTNYEMVDEAEQDDDTTYVSSSTVTDDELYTFAAMTVAMDTVNVVQVRGAIRAEDGGHREMRALCRSSTSESTGASQTVHSDRYRHLVGFIEQNPNGPAAWTDTTVNAAEFGFELVT